MRRSCPRAGCVNRVFREDQVVCTGDFTALASACRGKKRLGQPEADMIESVTERIAYRCQLCRQWHNGTQPGPMLLRITEVATATVQALLEDPRAGRVGVLLLADAWRPELVPRTQWSEGLDQREAFSVS